MTGHGLKRAMPGMLVALVVCMTVPVWAVGDVMLKNANLTNKTGYGLTVDIGGALTSLSKDQTKNDLNGLFTFATFKIDGQGYTCFFDQSPDVTVIGSADLALTYKDGVPNALMVGNLAGAACTKA